MPPASDAVPAELLTIRTFPSPNISRHCCHASYNAKKNVQVMRIIIKKICEPATLEQVYPCAMTSKRKYKDVRRKIN